MNEYDLKDAEVDELVRRFTYCVQPTPCHDDIMRELKGYIEENEKFMKRWNFQAGRRARKHLMNLWHLVRERRGEIAYTMYREGKDDERNDES